jgi:hypothetical protein
MTWTKPQNLNDNSIVTVNYWNAILGQNGSLQTINNQILTRANCNIATAVINSYVQIPNTTSLSTKTTRIGFVKTDNPIFQTYNPDTASSFTVYSPNENANFWPFTNTNRSNINQLITGVPFIVMWNFYLANAQGASIGGPFRIRTTLEREYRVNVDSDQTTVETIAAQYFYSFNTSTNATETYMASCCYVSHSNTDKYWITINHGLNYPMAATGNVIIITNPGMV